MSPEFTPLHFIGEPVEAHFDRPPALEKRPGCPQAFTWRGVTYKIVAVLAEWHNYQRRGRMARNMQPQHATMATKRGSWGVGQDYFRVRTNSGQVFDLNFDRAPQNSDHRQGAWFLDRELQEAAPED